MIANVHRKKLEQNFNSLDNQIISWMAKYGTTLLRISVGLIFSGFGVLKFIPGASPAESLATRTIETLSFGLIQPEIALPLLAIWETLVGLGLVFGVFLRTTLFLLFLQMLGTLTPLVLFPAEIFVQAPSDLTVPTLEGQYIIKNLVLITAGIVIGSTVRKVNIKE